MSMGFHGTTLFGTTNAVGGAVGTITSSSGTQAFTGNFTLGSLTASSVTSDFGGDVSFTTLVHNSGTARLIRNGAQSLAANGQSFNNLTITNVGTDTVTATQGVVVVGNLEIQANQVLAMGTNGLSVGGTTNAVGGAVGTITSSSGTQAFTGNFTLGSLTASSVTSDFGGDVSFTALVHNSGTVRLIRNGAQSLAANGQSFNNLTITNVGTDTVTATQGVVVVGNLEIQANQTLAMGTNGLSVGGTTNAVAGAGGTIRRSGGTQAFTGNFTVGSLRASRVPRDFG